jgi:dolichyl-diphosphooligosaccharide--protein glycosyltransferase
MDQNKLLPKLVTAIIIALFFGVALYLRIVLPYNQVFSGDWIKFTGRDAWYHMRIVDNLVHNFPHLNSFDPYMLYPYGSSLVGISSFFDYLLAGIIWLIGLGSPTQHTIDVVGVYFPAVLGALTVIPVYFIGKELFNRWAGVISAGLVALLPSEFLSRSILGFTDNHVAETLFTTVVILFLILAIKAGRDRKITFGHLWHRQWTTLTKPLMYSLLAGIFLGIYFLTWQGALLFVFIIFVYLIIQFIVDHLRGRATDYLCFVGTIIFIIALLMLLPISPGKLSLVSLIIAILIPLALAGLSRLIASRGIRPIFYPVALLGLGLASWAIFYIINPSLLKTMVGWLGIITAWPTKTTTLEMQPLLLPGGSFTLSLAWGNFTTGFFLSFISLGILIYFIVKRGEADKTLLVVWSLIILAATLAMRRFAYYFVVNVALLTGYLSWQILEFTGFKRLTAKPVETPGILKKGKAKVKKRGITASHIYMAFGVMFIVYLLAFFPKWDNCAVRMAAATASQTPTLFAPSDAWCESLSWLRDNTPEPFGDPNFYYQLYEPPLPGENYRYPETAYGVVAWWDYGYWITRLGRRIPITNPGGGATGMVTQIFVANEASANEVMDRTGSKYVIIDYATVTYKSQFMGGAYDVYYQPQEGKLEPIILFYPEYYRSLVVRLYNFDGRQVTPQSSTVISYQEKVSRGGVTYKEITSVQYFPSYKEAEAYISSQKSGNYKIVGNNPFISPVPLEALEHYKLVYSSDSSMTVPSVGKISEVKIFEYVKGE